MSIHGHIATLMELGAKCLAGPPLPLLAFSASEMPGIHVLRHENPPHLPQITWK